MVQIYSWYVFVPVLVGLFFLKRLNAEQKLILYIALLSGINHKASQLVMEMAVDHNNVWVYHIYIPILFWLTMRLYKSAIRVIYAKKLFDLILWISLVFFALNSFWIQGFKIVPTNAIFLMSGVFIFWGVSYFYSLLKQTHFKSLETDPVFWFSTGVIMYYSSTVLIFLLVYNYLERGTEATYIATILNAFFNLVLVTTYIISIWVKPPK
ncbi:MAG: hypothetical protein JJ978_08440 [Roseivirga sp.]|nr:hypothetical protein [Roseivirga sp.]MBO6495579.1 hypothetical protein [Roseivirga sp.]